MSTVSKINYISMLIVFLLVSLCTISCKKNRGVKYLTTDKDFKTWTFSNANTAASFMVHSIMKSKLQKNQYKKSKWIIMPEATNNTFEHINCTILMDKIKTKLVQNNIGLILGNTKVLHILKKENIDIQNFREPKIRKKIVLLTGASMIISGEISKQCKNTYIPSNACYAVRMLCFNLNTGTVEWSDSIEIKK